MVNIFFFVFFYKNFDAQNIFWLGHNNKKHIPYYAFPWKQVIKSRRVFGYICFTALLYIKQAQTNVHWSAIWQKRKQIFCFPSVCCACFRFRSVTHVYFEAKQFCDQSNPSNHIMQILLSIMFIWGALTIKSSSFENKAWTPPHTNMETRKVQAYERFIYILHVKNM